MLSAPGSRCHEKTPALLGVVGGAGVEHPPMPSAWMATGSEEVDFIFVAVIFLRLDPQSGQRKNEAAGNQKFHETDDL